jgi:hypothetical protein
MPAIATSKFRVHNAEQFLEAFSEANDTKMYFYIGGVSAFVDDANPPTPTNDTSSIEFSPWSDMYAAKRVQSTEVVQVIDRYNWTANTVYDQYDDVDADILDDDFYVMTADYNVYKCLSNNNGAQSTVEPTGTSTTEFQTLPDLYVWKYMYTVSTADALKFLTNEFIPVRTDSVVAAAAIDGGVHTYKITNAGSGYDDATYYSPLVGDGSGGIVKIVVSGGAITEASLQAAGSGYTSASVDLGDVYSDTGVSSATTIGAGSDGDITPIISPKGGHGADAEEELGGKFVMLNVRLDGDENGTISVDNDFRRVGLVRDPYDYGTTDVATVTNIRQTYRFTLTGVTNTFNVDDVVSVGSSQATVVEWDAANSYLYTTLPTLDTSVWTDGAVINGVAPSTGTGTIDVAGVNNPGLQPYSGDVLYIENRSPISRASDQIEDVKLVIEF